MNGSRSPLPNCLWHAPRGPQLHYETRINGEAVDPQKFLRAGLRLGSGILGANI